MSTVFRKSTEFHSCCNRDSCVRERERLLLVQKRLELQKERFELDREILEAEKLSFKKSIKLAAKHRNLTFVVDKGGAERKRKEFLELQQDEIENLRAQLKVFQKKEEKPKRGKDSTAGIAGINRSDEQQRRKIMKLKKELLEVKHELKATRKKHMVEKQEWEDGELGVDSSLKDEGMSTSQLLQISKAENKALRKENFRWKKSSEALSKIIFFDRKESLLGGTDILDRVAKAFEVLREERDMLKRKHREQSQQIDDWKLLLPRNKALLEKTMSQNKQLMKQLEDVQSGNQSTTQTEIQDTGQQHDGIFDNTMSDMNTVCLEHTTSCTNTLPTTPSSISPDESKLLIPSDFSPEDLRNLDKKFVVEWEWASDKNGMRGLFTGWLDLEGNPIGNGTLRIEDGGIYMGEWKAGRRNGNGVYFSIDGAIYSGPWQNDKFQGRGVYVSETNQVTGKTGYDTDLA